MPIYTNNHAGRDQLVAKRVRYLRIQQLLVHEPESQAMLAGVGKATLIERNAQFMTLDFDWTNPERELDRYMSSAITNMRNAISCTWDFYHFHTSIPLPLDFCPNWPPFCHKLERLKLCSPVTSTARGLESAHFPCLHDLSIYLSGDDHKLMDWTDGPPVLDILASFVSRLSPTLKRLDIRAHLYLSPSFFGKLDHFPHLIKLEIAMPIVPSDMNDQISHFIAKHAATLEYLSFFGHHHPFLSGASSEPVLQIFSFGLPLNFRRLRTLSLDVPKLWSTHGIALAACIRPFVHTVTTLILKQQYLSLEELVVVSNAFARSPGVLTSAWLDLERLTPQTVDLLAEGFQSLTDLTLTTSLITSDDSYSEVCTLLTLRIAINTMLLVGRILQCNGGAHVPAVVVA
jgi:hypothetical protein